MNKSIGPVLVVMCAICQKLDQQIVRYREFMTKVPDTQFADGLAKMIEEAEAQKARLHPTRELRPPPNESNLGSTGRGLLACFNP